MTEEQQRMLIAIDGPAASGKGSLGRRLAKHLGLDYLDTGKLYRYVGYKLIEEGYDLDDITIKEKEVSAKAVEAANNIDITDIEQRNLGSEKIGKYASVASAIPEVRDALLDFQRNVAKSKRGAILDGRDIGTVVCPDADYKFFITANIEIRAERRHKELQNKGNEVIYTSVLDDLKQRDDRDSKRAIAPLKPSVDAIFVDTTTLNADEVFELVLGKIDRLHSKYSIDKDDKF